MPDSILTYTKKLLGIDAEETDFDPDIILFINSAIAAYYQIGVGERDFIITGTNETWDDYEPDPHIASLLKTGIFYRVKLAFDPPASSSAMQALKELSAEADWRISCVTVSSQRTEDL